MEPSKCHIPPWVSLRERKDRMEEVEESVKASLESPTLSDESEDCGGHPSLAEALGCWRCNHPAWEEDRKVRVKVAVDDNFQLAVPDTRTGPTQNVLRTLPEGRGERKDVPITTGVIDYFPLALAEVARLSKAGNDQHNPGQPLHWARGKSADHADCLVRHLIQRGTLDSDGISHTAKVAWRALALLQEELEAAAGFTP